MSSISPSAQNPVIGFIGYGAMASRMGQHLLKAGYDVAVYTPSGRPRGNTLKKEAEEKEVLRVATPGDIAGIADIIILCVPDDAAENTALYGEEGLLAGLKRKDSKDCLLLDMSTVSPAQADHLAALGEMHHFSVMDCPVSGSTPEAEKASLIILAGGTEETLARARPVLERLGRIIIHTGPSGTAARAKLMVNGIMGATLSVIGEGLAYGVSEGIDRSVLFSTLQELAVISPHHKRKLSMAEEGTFPPQFPASLMSKDMGLLLDAGRHTGIAMPSMAVAAQSLAHTARYHAQEDYSVLLQEQEQDAVLPSVTSPKASPEQESSQRTDKNKISTKP